MVKRAPLRRYGRVPSALSCLFLAGCGAAAETEPKTPAPTASSSAAPPAKAEPRAASAALLRYAGEGEQAFALYADVAGLMHTELFEGLVPAVLEGMPDLLQPAQRDCLRVALFRAKELAVVTRAEGPLTLVRFDPEGAKAVRSACLGVVVPAETIKVDGATEAYASGEDVIALESNVLIVGARSVVAAALVPNARTKPLAASLRLQQGQYIAWQVRSAGVEGQGSLSVEPQLFRLDVDVTLPNEAMAQMVESQMNEGRATLQLRAQGENAAMVGGLLDRLSVKRDGRRFVGAFALPGTAPEQAQALGTALALGMDGARTYLVNVKQAEAKGTLAQITKRYAVALNAPAKNGAPLPFAKRRLTSLPAVPAAIPRATKYQSQPSDWQAWQAIQFSMSAPQYYQYEVVASKDGKSAEVIARGDLDGDGKPSTFVLKVRLDPKEQALLAEKLEATDAGE